MSEIQPPDFRYTLICLGKEWVLPQHPKGWEEGDLNWKRSTTYHGMVRSYSTPLQFVLDGAWLLRRVYYTQGIEGKCQIKIEILDRKNWYKKSIQYQVLYIGDIDFSTFQDEKDFVEVMIMDRGAAAAVAAYDTVKYEIDLDPGSLTVRLPGIDAVDWVRNTAGLIWDAGSDTGPNPQLYVVDTAISDTKLIGDKIDPNPQIQTNVNIIATPNYFQTSDNFIFRADESTNLRITGKIQYAIRVSTSFKIFRLRFVDSANGLNSTVATLFMNDPLTPNVDHIGEFAFDVNFDIIAGRNYFIIADATTISGAWAAEKFDFTSIEPFEISYGLTTEPSLIKAVRLKTLFERLMLKMGSTEPVESNTFSQWNNLLVTCGDAIRGLSDARIKTSFKDFFKSVDAVLNVGFGIERGVSRIEMKHYWFRELQILDLGEVKDVLVEPAEEFLFNSIKAGYPDDDYEVENGREEYNSEQIWATVITRMQRQVDLSSVYRADQYGMEQVRLAQINSDNANKVDKKQDNDVFFIHVKKEPGEDGIYDVIGEEDYLDISGIGTRSSSYNMGITPKKNLLRHGNILRSILPDSSVIVFASSTKNAQFSTTDLNGVTVKENVGILVSSLDRALFHPIAVTLTTKLPPRVQEIMETNACGYMKFTYRDHPFYGYILEASQDVARNSEREFKLLLTRDSDPTKLIY